MKSLKLILRTFKDDRITIIVFRGAHEIKRIYLRSLIQNVYVYISLFFIIGFIVLLSSVIYLERTNKSLKNTIASLEEPIITDRKPPVANEPESEKIDLEDKDLSSAQESTIEPPSDPFPDINSSEINIIDIETYSLNLNTHVSFKLENLQKVQRVSGYVTVLGFSEDIDPEIYSSYPGSLQVNDEFNLINFRSGEYFSIQWFKNIDVTLAPLPSNTPIKILLITLYSRSGEILLRKKIET